MLTTHYLTFDIETRGKHDIKLGLDKYASGAEVILWQWALDDGDVVIEEGPRPSADLQHWLHDPLTTIVAHNAAFERTLLERTQGLRIHPNRFWCTMAQACSHGLPGGLEALGDIFGLAEDQAKIKEGRRLIRMFCVPDKEGNFKTKADKPAEWERFREYAARDVVATRALRKKMPTWNYPGLAFERRLYAIDQEINDRGFEVDLDLATAVVEMVAEAKADADEKVVDLTDGDVSTVMKRDRVLSHVLIEHGVALPDMRADTLERRLADESLPDEVRQLLAMRLEIAQTSTSKYKKLVGCHVGGRLRHTLQYCGARRTRRWAGRLFQPQNLARPTMKWGAVQEGIEAILGGYASALYTDVTSLASNCVRSVIRARDGHVIVASDLANIEGRGLAWEAGEQWKLDAFAAYDADVGPDLYIASYARAFGLEPSQVSKPDRQVGKVLELSMGYGGGVGAFAAMAGVYRLDIDALAVRALAALPADLIAEADRMWDWAFEHKRTYGMKRETFVALDGLKRAWRAAHPATVEFWGDVDRAVRRVINVPKDEVQVGQIGFSKHRSWLRMHLPSGGVLCYPDARIEDSGDITYLGVNQYTHQWGRIKTYSGKLVENATQAIARDVLADGLIRAIDRGFSPVLTVHDELVTEEPIGVRDHNDLAEIMSTTPAWAPGLPLAAAGFTDPRYHKED